MLFFVTQKRRPCHYSFITHPSSSNNAADTTMSYQQVSTSLSSPTCTGGKARALTRISGVGSLSTGDRL